MHGGASRQECLSPLLLLHSPSIMALFFANLPRVSGICEAFSYHIGFYSVVEAHDPGNSPAKAVDGIQGGKLGLLSAWYYVYYTYRASLLLLLFFSFLAGLAEQ